MSDKLLSEQCVEYCDIVEKYSETEDKIMRKILEIVKLYNKYAYTIDSYYHNNGNLDVYYTESCCGCSDFGTHYFPVKWLDLDKEDLRKVVEADKEEMRKLYEEQKKKEQEKQQQAAEEEDRIEYERLKAKFEKEEK
jgi:hypothetical protein